VYQEYFEGNDNGHEENRQSGRQQDERLIRVGMSMTYTLNGKTS